MSRFRLILSFIAYTVLESIIVTLVSRSLGTEISIKIRLILVFVTNLLFYIGADI